MTADMIRQLPAGHALVVRGGYAPVVARLGAAWKDRAYKTARRRDAAITALTTAPEPAAPDGTPGGNRVAGAWPPRLTIVPDPDAEDGPADPSDSAYPWS
jgi:hypothetical protein